MSLKSIVKKCCPDFLLPVLRVPYRIAAWPYRTAVHFMRTRIIARRALKYLPYYQDEESREILADRIKYLKTGDNDIFLKRAQKEGCKIPGIIGDELDRPTRTEEQYLDVFAPLESEIVVDAGCYDGATALRFLKWGGDRIRHIYSFEFDPINAAKCEENLRQYADKITLVKKGTWDKDEIIYTNARGGGSSNVISEGNTQVQLASIDNELAEVPVTFIKMDIEGAELKSLIGAKNIIIKNHPRLAICVYHKPEDIYEIPGYILSLVPEYKFYLRHYSSRDWETVLYAYCE